MLKSRSRRTGWSSNASSFWSSGINISREQTEKAFSTALLQSTADVSLRTCPGQECRLWREWFPVRNFAVAV